jgi:hypothetical protein
MHAGHSHCQHQHHQALRLRHHDFLRGNSTTFSIYRVTFNKWPSLHKLQLQHHGGFQTTDIQKLDYLKYLLRGKANRLRAARAIMKRTECVGDYEHRNERLQMLLTSFQVKGLSTYRVVLYNVVSLPSLCASTVRQHDVTADYLLNIYQRPTSAQYRRP